MADTDLTGHWKGLLVFSHRHSEVHLYFEQNGTALTGTYEAPGLPSGDSKGEFTGSISADNKVTLTVVASLTIEFDGELTGQHSRHEMLYGVVIALAEPVGTLSLFPKELPGGVGIFRY